MGDPGAWPEVLLKGLFGSRRKACHENEAVCSAELKAMKSLWKALLSFTDKLTVPLVF